MKKFVSLFFTLSLVLLTTQSCNVGQGLAGISPEKALSGVQALLGGSSKNALKGFAGNVLKNAVMQKVMPKELSSITGLLGKTGEGAKALNLLNGALGSAVPDVAASLLGNATKGILRHLINKQRYDLEDNTDGTTLSIMSVTKERKAVITQNGSCDEKVSVVIYVPNDFDIKNDNLLVRNEKDIQPEITGDE